MERRNEQIMVQTSQQKKDNKSIKFDMIKDDIISDITEIRKNHKGLLCNPIDGSPLGSAVPGILQARTLEIPGAE